MCKRASKDRTFTCVQRVGHSRVVAASAYAYACVSVLIKEEGQSHRQVWMARPVLPAGANALRKRDHLCKSSSHLCACQNPGTSRANCYRNLKLCVALYELTPFVWPCLLLFFSLICLSLPRMCTLSGFLVWQTASHFAPCFWQSVKMCIVRSVC